MMSNIIDFIAKNAEKSGRTTRLANGYIQSFFTRERYTPIFIRDHVGGNDDKLLSIIEDRLKFEHGLKAEEYIINYDEHYLIRIYDRQTERRKYLIESAMATNIKLINIVPELARATGMSTLIVDETIERIFQKENEWVAVRDHYGTRQSDTLVLERICERMERESPLIKLDIDKHLCRIRLKKSED